MREFRPWAGYAPRPVPSGGFAFGIGAVAAAAAAAGAEAEATADTPPEVSDKAAAAATGRGGRQSRARTRSDVVAAPASGDERGDQTSSRALGYARTHARARTRSVSARSMACPASGGGGRVAKRSKSSGPPGRGVRGRPQLRTPGGTAAGGEQAVGGRAPWGAGPRVGGARARAQAWASTHLDNAKPYGFGGGSGGGSGRGGNGGGDGDSAGTGQARKSDGASGGARTAHSRARVRRGRVAGGGEGGCGGTHAAARNLVAKETGKNVRGGNRVGRKPSRRGAGAGSAPRPRRGGGAGGNGGEPGRVRGVGFGAEQSTCGRPLGRAGRDITWDVLDDEGCDSPEFGARRAGGRGFHEGAGNGVQEDARTGRVVEMLASLEKAVVDVCKVR